MPRGREAMVTKAGRIVHAKAPGSICLVLALGVLLLAGCAEAPKASGFLRDYAALRPVPGASSVLYYEKPNVQWKRYTRLMLDPVVVYYAPDAPDRQIQPDDLKRLTDYFRTAAVEAVRDAYPVVETPGPGVLRIRAAITDVVPANPLLNVVTTAAVFIPLDMGGAAMEAEFLDSVTNERLAAIIERKTGMPLDPRDMIRGFTKWGHAEAAFRAWAKELREVLDEAQRGK